MKMWNRKNIGGRLEGELFYQFGLYGSNKLNICKYMQKTT